jgi:hypothetical protein
MAWCSKPGLLFGAPQTRHELGITLQGKDWPEEAIVEFRAAIRLKPDDTVWHFHLVGELRALQRFTLGLHIGLRCQLETPGPVRLPAPPEVLQGNVPSAGGRPNSDDQ